MDIIQTIVLAIVQGITEFLPISSSAHLILISELLGWSDQGIAFDVALHLGTLLAVLYYFRSEISDMMRAEHFSSVNSLVDSQFGIIALSTLPIVIVGGLFNDFISQNLRSSSVIASASIFFGIILYLADLKQQQREKVVKLSLRLGLIIGLFQILALIPGTSRSGITIAMGLFLGLSRVEASRFSFLLAIPVIMAASVFQLYELFTDNLISINYVSFVFGMAISAVIAFLTIHWFLEFVRRIGMLPFAIYRVLLGLIIILTI
jgi:undecaprenyl-diphosphatase